MVKGDASLAIQCSQPEALTTLVANIEFGKRRSPDVFEPFIRPLTLAGMTGGGGRDPLEFVAVLDSPATIHRGTPITDEHSKEGYLMYTEPDDVLDTASDPWKSGYFQIRYTLPPRPLNPCNLLPDRSRLNTLFLTDMERHPSFSDATPSRRLPKKFW